MSPIDVHVVVAPGDGALAVGFVLAGVALGTVSGLVPGLHANNFALLLAAFAPSVPAPARLVGAAMLAAGVVHTFLDVVPAMALGVPDPAMAASALPGHRLVLGGRGREALRLSALGSGLAVALAVPLAIPITAAMTRVYPYLRAVLPVVLLGVAVVLIATEHTWLARVGGTVAFVASGGLGAVTLDFDAPGILPVGDVLAPLFAGLFGAPVLLTALRGAGVPPQADHTLWLERRVVGLTALAGTVSGAIVGYIPGVSSAVAAVLVLPTIPGDAGDRGFIVATSGVNTATAVFALFALVALGSPRTGVLVALERAKAPLHLPLLLSATVLAAACGFVLVVTLGDRFLELVSELPYRGLCLSVLVGLVAVAVLFAGPPGAAILAVSTVVGLVPVVAGAKRVHCMGVLMLPIALGM